MRKLFVFKVLALFSLPLFSQVNIQRLDSGILVLDNRQNVLFYRTQPDVSHGLYQRANYIHPLYSLDGEILTEDRPEDHPHHHGIFWAWHQLYVGDKRIGDGWINKDVEWEIVSTQTTKKGQAVQLEVLVHWLSPLWLDTDGDKEPVVIEKTQVIVYPAKQDYRQIDFSISLLATQPDTRIGGSEDTKGYGGFSPRIRLPKDITFTGHMGKVIPQTNPVEATGWLDISGSLGYKGTQAGVAILSHPDNPGYPNPWILRRKGSMQNAVYPHPGAQPVALSNINPTILRYRLIIHGEKVPDLPELFGDYMNQ